MAGKTASAAPPDAFERASRLLALRPHFRAELASKLIQKGHQRSEVDEAVARLARLGYLDDVALARSEADRLRRTRRLGATAIAARLGRKGAPAEAVRAALDEVDPEADLELAREAARGWLGRHRPDGSALARHLHRKGHTRRVIFRVLNELLPDAETTPEAD